MYQLAGGIYRGRVRYLEVEADEENGAVNRGGGIPARERPHPATDQPASPHTDQDADLPALDETGCRERPGIYPWPRP